MEPVLSPIGLRGDRLEWFEDQLVNGANLILMLL